MFYPADLTTTLHSIPWFVDLDQKRLERLAQITELMEVKANQTLFCEGEKDAYVYVVLEGKIAVDMVVPSRGSVRIFVAEPLDILGWSSLTPVVRQRTATALALTCSRVAAINTTALQRLCDEDARLGYVIMRRISNVVASRLLTTRLQLLDLIAEPSQDEKPGKSYSE